jgi:hypothetical protein
MESATALSQPQATIIRLSSRQIWLEEDQPPTQIEGTRNQEAGADKVQKAVR